MTRTLSGTLVLLFLLPAMSSAHRLDEYLQATRVAVARERIAIELDLTPGVSLASEVIASIDRDGNGNIAANEASAYAATVVAEAVLVVDGRDVPLSLSDVRVPAIALMRAGLGAIRIGASGALASHSTGRHELFYRNNHRPDVSVYLVNALMPDSRTISVVRQRRDVRQREFHLEYVVSGYSAMAWSIGAVLGLAALALSRRGVPVPSRLAG